MGLSTPFVFALLLAAIGPPGVDDPPPPLVSRIDRIETKIAAPFFLEVVSSAGGPSNSSQLLRFEDVNDPLTSESEKSKGVEWSIPPGQGAKLVRLFPAEGSVPSIGIRCTDDPADSSSILVTQEDQAPLKNGRPGVLIFHVEDLAGLRRRFGSGIYQGTLAVLLEPRRQDGVKKEMPIRLTLVIPGRSVARADFAEATDQTLRVGHRASVRVRFEEYFKKDTPPELPQEGDGRLDLRWAPDGSQSRKVFASRPIPSRPDEFARSATPDDRWSWGINEPILPTVTTTHAIEEPAPGVGRRVSEILVPLPDLNRTGEVSGAVTWKSTWLDLPELPERSLPATRIRYGLLVSSRLALVGETIDIKAIFSGQEAREVEAWGNALVVKLKKPNNLLESLTLSRLESVDSIVYEGSFAVATTGRHEIVFDPSQVGVKAAQPEKITIWAPLETSSEIPTEGPLVVFGSALPLLWNSANGDSVCLRRKDALDLILHTKKPARVRLDGVYRENTEFAIRATSPGDPSLVVVEQSHAESEVQNKGRRAGLESLETPTIPWDLKPSIVLRTDLIVSIAEKTGMKPGDRALKTHAYQIRWLIEGEDDDGNPFARFHDLPVQVRVASEKELEFVWVWIVPIAAGLLLILMVYLFVHLSRGSGGPQQRVVLTSLEDELSHPMSSVDPNEANDFVYLPPPQPKPDENREPSPFDFDNRRDD